jgi:hypothetical protein
MFQMFRQRDDKKTTRDILLGEKYKNQYARRRALPALRGSRSPQNLFHSEKHRSASDIDRYQVIIN